MNQARMNPRMPPALNAAYTNACKSACPFPSHPPARAAFPRGANHCPSYSLSFSVVCVRSCVRAWAGVSVRMYLCGAAAFPLYRHRTHHYGASCIYFVCVSSADDTKASIYAIKWQKFSAKIGVTMFAVLYLRGSSPPAAILRPRFS